MTGIEHLRLVKRHVPETGSTPRRKLKKAAAEFEAAFRADSQDWPLRFRNKAAAIRAVLTRHGGTDETVDQLAPAEVKEVIASLRLFCDEAERESGARRY